MSYITDILLTARYIPRNARAEIEDVDLGRGQTLTKIDQHAVGGHRVWTADTWAAAVNHARPIPDILDELAAIITYSTQATLHVHREESDDHPEVYWIHNGRWVELQASDDTPATT